MHIFISMAKSCCRPWKLPNLLNHTHFAAILRAYVWLDFSLINCYFLFEWDRERERASERYIEREWQKRMKKHTYSKKKKTLSDFVSRNVYLQPHPLNRMELYKSTRHERIDDRKDEKTRPWSLLSKPQICEWSTKMLDANVYFSFFLSLSLSLLNVSNKYSNYVGKGSGGRHLMTLDR